MFRDRRFAGGKGGSKGNSDWTGCARAGRGGSTGLARCRRGRGLVERPLPKEGNKTLTHCLQLGPGERRVPRLLAIVGATVYKTHFYYLFDVKRL